ncbi:MAG: oligopeptide/dipeptide ABC transporter ATP-binding protein [Bacillota bacterium]
MLDNGCLLDVKNLKVYFPVKGELIPKIVGNVKAVDDVSFDVRSGETLGMVGESGCGKSTIAKAILRLVNAAAGEVFFEGENLLKLNGKRLKAVRKKIQLVFQDPFAALNPRLTIGGALDEVLYIHRLGQSATRKKRAAELMEMVGLTRSYLSRYPHEFSGGQRQRLVIARALAVDPKLIICDEPVSALDVSIQAQIINLLEELQERLQLTYLFISHDLSVVRHICGRVAVMYLGKIVEIAAKDDLFADPRHPYTVALLSAIPICDPDAEVKKILLEGDMPSPVDPPSGCRFHTRCFREQEICSREEPLLKDMGGGHFVACHF